MDSNLQDVISKKLADVENNVLKNLERLETRWSSDKDTIKDILISSQKNNANNNSNSNNATNSTMKKKRLMLSESLHQHRKLDNFERTLKGFVNDMESSLRDIVSPDWNNNNNNDNNHLINDIDRYDYPSSIKTKRASPRADNNGYKLVVPASSVTITSTTTTPTTPNNRNRGRGRPLVSRPSSTNSNRSLSPSKHHPFFVDDYNTLDLANYNDYATRGELDNLETKVIDSFREMIRASEQQTIQLNTVAEVVLSLQEKCEILEDNNRPKSALSRLTQSNNDNDKYDNKVIDYSDNFDRKINSINNYMQKKFDKIDDECTELTTRVTENKKNLDTWKAKLAAMDSTHEDIRYSLDKMKHTITNPRANDNNNNNVISTTTIDVKIDDIISRLTKLEYSNPSNDYKVGDNVEGNYLGRGKWYPGKIINYRDNDYYDISYDDDDKESETRVFKDMIRPIVKEEQPIIITSSSSSSSIILDDIMSRLKVIENHQHTSNSNNDNSVNPRAFVDLVNKINKIEDDFKRNQKANSSSSSSSSSSIDPKAFDDLVKKVNKIEDNINKISSSSSNNVVDPKAFDDFVKKINKIEINVNKISSSNSSSAVDPKAFDDIIKKVNKIEDNFNTSQKVNSNNNSSNNSVVDPKAFVDFAKKVTKIEDNINKAMGDVFERLRFLEKNLPSSSSSNKSIDFENYMKKTNEALLILQGKVIDVEKKRPSSKKDRRKSTSDTNEVISSTPFSSKKEDKTNAKADNSSTKIITKTDTNTKTSDDWEVSSVKTESDPIEIVQSSIDAIKQQIAQEEMNIIRLTEEKSAYKAKIKDWISSFKKENGREPNEDDKAKNKTLFESYQEKVFMKEDAELFLKELFVKLRLKDTELTNMKNNELFKEPGAESIEFQKIKDSVTFAPDASSSTATNEEGKLSIKRLSKSGSSSINVNESSSSSSSSKRKSSSKDGSRESSRESRRSSKRTEKGNDDVVTQSTSVSSTSEKNAAPSSSSRSRKSSKSGFNGGATTALIDYSRHESDRKQTAQYKQELASSAKLSDPKFEEERLRSQIKAAETDLLAINEEKSYRKNIIREFINAFKAKNGREPTSQEKQDQAAEIFMLYSEIMKRKDETESRLNKLMIRLSGSRPSTITTP